MRVINCYLRSNCFKFNENFLKLTVSTSRQSGTGTIAAKVFSK